MRLIGTSVVGLLAALALAVPAATFADPAAPSTVYVAAGGSDVGSCATAAAACQSITYALRQVATGGTVYVSGTLDVDGVTADGDASGAGIEIYRDVTIAAAPGASSATIDGDGTNWLFYVNDGAWVTFDGVTLENGFSTRNAVGGAITNGGIGTVTIENCTLSGNSATGFAAGGAVNNSASGTVNVSGSSFDADDASDHGGAINNADAETGTLNVSDSTFSEDGDATEGHADGGAIDNGGDNGSGTVRISGSTFSGNDGWNGGAIDTSDGGGGGHDSVTITGSTFTGNASHASAGQNGGAINSGPSIGSTLRVSASTFTGNTTDGNGGAINSQASQATIEGSTFTENTAARSGGAVANGWVMTVSGSRFDHNTAGQDAGALDSSAELTVTGSTFSANTAASNGGAIDAGDGAELVNVLYVSDSTFNGNTSTSGDGGAVDTADGGGDSALILTDSTLQGNSAGKDGGAVDNGDNGWQAAGSSPTGFGELTVAASTFADNTAPWGGNVANGASGGEADAWLAGNLFDGSCGLELLRGSWNDQGYEAATDSTCVNGGTADAVDPTVGTDLGPLANNGGPTETMLPAAGDPAIGLIPTGTEMTVGPGNTQDDVSLSCPPASDQRGALAAPGAGTPCDAGSVQTWGVTATASAPRVMASPTDNSLAKAISAVPAPQGSPAAPLNATPPDPTARKDGHKRKAGRRDHDARHPHHHRYR